MNNSSLNELQPELNLYTIKVSILMTMIEVSGDHSCIFVFYSDYTSKGNTK